MLSLDVNLMPGWSKQALHISDFTEPHWQTGAVLSTGKENAVEQWEYMRDQWGCKPIHHWTRHCKGGTSSGTGWKKSSAQREPEVQGSSSQLIAIASHSVRNCSIQWISKMSLLQSQTHLEELLWEPKSLFLFCLNGKRKICVRYLKSPLSLPIPLPHLLSPEILRPGKRSYPQPPPSIVSWQPEMWELHGDRVHERSCAAGTSPAWVRNLATHAEHTIWKRSATSSNSSSSQAMKPGLERIAGFFRSLWSHTYKELQVFSGLWYLL